MIEIHRLQKFYGDFPALREVSFSAPEGEVVGLLGPNGAGKSSTMKIITGVLPPSAGQVRVAGFDVRLESRQARRCIGYLPENAPVYGEMRVKNFVRFMTEAKGLRGRECQKAVDQALEECGLTHMANRLLQNCSKGYRQRAGLAQALAGNPKLLVLDEPTVGLDPAQVREMRNLIRSLAGERTVLVSTHILSEAALICDRVVILGQGRVLAQGTPDSIRASGRWANTLRVMVRGDFGAVQSALAGLESVSRVIPPDSPDSPTADEFVVEMAGQEDCRADISRRLVEAGLELLEMRSEGLSLEDIFLHTVAEEAPTTEEDGL